MNYNINSNNLSKVFCDIKNKLEKEIEIIGNLLKIDYKYCNFKVEVNILKYIVNLLENEKLKIDKEQKIVVHFNGNPYVTLNLCILAILTKTTLILEFDEYMLAINSFIVKTINDVLNNFLTDSLIYIAKRNTEIDLNVEKIVCIDDINLYNKYLLEKSPKVEFYALNYIDFYNDSDDFEELEELIYKYAQDNRISLESYSEFEIAEAIERLKEGVGEKIVLLTNNEETKKKFQINLKNKKIFINENPFKTDIQLIKREIF